MKGLMSERPAHRMDRRWLSTIAMLSAVSDHHSELGS